MKYFLIVLLSFGNAFGQDILSEDEWSHIDYMYGNKVLEKKFMASPLNDYKQIEVGRPISYIGIGITSEFAYANRLKYMGHFDYAQILPQQVVIQDSIQAKIKGFNLVYSLLGMDFFKRSDVFDLVGTIGFNTGRLKLKGEDGFKYKNPYFSPMVSLSPRIVINNWSFFVRATYEYDISKKGWRAQLTSKATQNDLPYASSTGFNVFAGIGYRFWY